MCGVRGSSVFECIFDDFAVPNLMAKFIQNSKVILLTEIYRLSCFFFIVGIGFESHWVPYWRACTPCTFKYDAIANLGR